MNRRLPRIAVLLFGGLVAWVASLGARADDPAPATGLVIEVRDEKGKGLAGAEVWVWQERGEVRSELTDALGITRLPDLRAGAYSLMAQAEGHVGVQKDDVAVASEGDTRVQLKLAPGVPFDGVVLGRGGVPLAQAQIAVEAGGVFEGKDERRPDTTLARLYADEQGRFHVKGIPPKSIATVKVWVNGYEDTEVAVRASDVSVSPSPLEIRPAPGPRLYGTVTSSDGKPLAAAIVFAAPADNQAFRSNPWVGGGGSKRWSRTAADGTYEIMGLDLNGAVAVGAQAPGHRRYAWREAPPSSKEARDVRVDLVLEPSTRIVLRVVDAKGKPVEGVEHIYAPPGAYSEPEQGPGVLSFNEMQPGERSFHIHHAEYLDELVSVDAKAGQTVERAVTLNPGVRIVGTVVTADGTPAAGAGSVWASDLPDSELGGRSRQARVGAGGEFVLKGLPSEPRRLSFESTSRWVLPTPLDVVAPATGVVIRLQSVGQISVRLEGAVGEAPETINATHIDYEHKSIEYTRDSAGVFVIDAPPRKGRMLLEIPGHAFLLRTVEVPLGGSVDWGAVRLEEGNVLEGRVVDAQGKPVGSANLQMHDHIETYSDDQGHFRFEGLPRGRVELTVKASDFIESRVEIDIVAARVEKDVVAYRGGLLVGKVESPDPRLERASTLVAERAPLTAEGKWTPAGKTDIGYADFELRLSPGRYRLFVPPQGDDAPQVLAEVDVKEGETVRVELVQKLPRRTAAQWVAVLDGDDAAAKVSAVLGLREGEKSPDAVRALVTALGSDDAELRVAAAETLGAYGDVAHHAVPALVARLEDAQPRVRAAAMRALAELPWGSHPVDRSLLAMLGRGVGPWSDPRLVGRALGGVIAKRLPKTASAAVLDQLKSPNPDVRRLALLTLGGMGASAQGAVPAMLVLLDDEDSGVRSTVADALQDLGPLSAAALPILEQKVRSTNDFHALENAYDALAALGPIALPVMLDAMKEPLRAQAAVRKFERLGADAAPAIPAIFGLLKSSKFSNFYELTLVSIGPESLAYSRRALSDSGSVRTALVVIAAFAEKASEAVPDVVAILDDEKSPDRAEAAVALGAIARFKPSDAVLPSLHRAAESAPVAVRAASLHSLRFVDPSSPASAQRFLAAASAVEPEVRVAALYGLSGIRWSDRAEATTAILRALSDPVPTVRSAAAVSIGTLYPVSGEMITALIAALGDSVPQVRVDAAVALGKMGPRAESSLPALDRLTQDADASVVRAAQQAVQLIRPK